MAVLNLKFPVWWWWCQICLFDICPLPAEMIQFDDHIFQMGGEKPPTSFMYGAQDFTNPKNRIPECNFIDVAVSCFRSKFKWFSLSVTWSTISDGASFGGLGPGAKRMI